LVAALERLGAHRAPARVAVDLDAASLEADPPVGLTREPAAVALELGLLLAGVAGGEALLRAFGAAEAAAEPLAELPLAALLRLAHATALIAAEPAETVEALLLGGAGRRPRSQGRRADGEQRQNRNRDQEPSDQSTVAVPPPVMVTFSVFLPSFSCHTSTS
jgi:hypothetical protein